MPDKLDQLLIADLARQGLVVTSIQRSPARLMVAVRTAKQTPLVAVVDRGLGERTIAFAHLMTKATVA